MKKLLLSLLIACTFYVNATELMKEAVSQTKPVFIKNAIDKSLNIFNWLINNRVCKLLVDNKVSNTFTQDEYVQQVWTDKLGKSVLIASPFYLAALYHMNKRPKWASGNKYNYNLDHSKQIDNGFSALNYALIGAIVQATTYAYLNK